MEGLHSYLREEGPATGKRIRAKILGAAGLVAFGGTAWAIAGQRRIWQTVPSITANAAIAMATFAVCQESVRAARHGQHDAWNSAAAGSLTGALLTRAAYGRGFHVLGFVVWGPICGALHLANSILQPGAIMKSFLSSQGLLDLPQQQQQQQHLIGQHQIQQQLNSATAESGAESITLQPRSVEDISEAEKNRWAEEIKQRELAELKALWRQQEQRAKAAAAGLGVEQAEQQQQQQQQDGTGGKRWWGLLG